MTRKPKKVEFHFDEPDDDPNCPICGNPMILHEEIQLSHGAVHLPCTPDASHYAPIPARTAVLRIDQLRLENEQLRAQLKDTGDQFDDILNHIWGIVYPGKTDWDYPGQVYNHVRVEIEHLQAENARLKNIIAIGEKVVNSASDKTQALLMADIEIERLHQIIHEQKQTIEAMKIETDQWRANITTALNEVDYLRRKYGENDIVEGEE